MPLWHGYSYFFILGAFGIQLGNSWLAKNRINLDSFAPMLASAASIIATFGK